MLPILYIEPLDFFMISKYLLEWCLQLASLVRQAIKTSHQQALASLMGQPKGPLPSCRDNRLGLLHSPNLPMPSLFLRYSFGSHT